MDARGGRQRGGSGSTLAVMLFGALALLAGARPASACASRSDRSEDLASLRRVAALRFERPDGAKARGLVRALVDARGDDLDLPAVLRSLRAGSDGRLPDTALVGYLRWRRGLAPARFDRWHPRIGRLLAREATAAVVTTPPACVCPCTPPPAVAGARTGPSTPEVPEPSSVLVAAALCGAFAWTRRWRD